MKFLRRLIDSFNTYPQRDAIFIADKHYSYSAFAARISAIQVKLQQHWDEQQVGVVMGDHVDTYASVIALLLMGRTYVPINPSHPAERSAQILEQANLRLILTGLPYAGVAGSTVVNTSELADVTETPFCTTEDVDSKYAYILFTSGSTGVPKGTPITYHNLDYFVTAFFALGYQMSEQDRFLQMFDLTFDLSVMSYLIPLCIGASVYPVPEKGMKFMTVYSILEEHNISFALMVPSILSSLRQYFPEISLPAMRYSLFCGEALHKDVSLEWMKCIPNAIVENVYGPTEATIFCLTYRLDPTKEIVESNGIVCIGTPMEGMGAIVADENNQPVADGEKGELCLSGHQLTPGYLDPEKSKPVFFDLNGVRHYRTGDIAYRRTDGNFIYCGRLDHQVKIQGFRVELGEIEHHARTVYACNAVAIPVTNAQGMSQIDIVLEKETTNKDTIIAGLKDRLPSYMVPTEVHFITPFPLNVNGKIDRKALTKTILGS